MWWAIIIKLWNWVAKFYSLKISVLLFKRVEWGMCIYFIFVLLRKQLPGNSKNSQTPLKNWEKQESKKKTKHTNKALPEVHVPCFSYCGKILLLFILHIFKCNLQHYIFFLLLTPKLLNLMENYLDHRLSEHEDGKNWYTFQAKAIKTASFILGCHTFNLYQSTL